MRGLAFIIGGAILVAPYSCLALASSLNGFVRGRAMIGNGKTISTRSHSLIATGMDGQKEKDQKAVDQQPGSKEKPRSVARVGDASASPLLSGTFEVILLGFTVDRQTRDDALQRDGVGDEVFLVSPSNFLIDTLSREIRRNVGGHGAVYGQRRSSTSAVIQAGTASETGGLRTGDQFPQPTPWVYRNDGIAGDAIPHIFFLSEITQGANVMAVIPSLWEWDNNDEAIQYTYVDMMADRNLARAVSPFIARSPTSLRDSIKTFSELGLPLRLSIGRGPLGLGEVNNRPIGMVRSGDRYTFDPQVLILTYQMADMIARTDFGKGNGVIEMRYKD